MHLASRTASAGGGVSGHEVANGRQSRSSSINLFRERRADWGFAVLKAHIDDSGSDDQNDYCVLGGLLAPPYTWGYVEEDWDRALDRWDIGYFKMSEAHNFEGKFRGWERPKRDECVGEFLAIIVDRYLMPVASAMKKSDLRSVLDEMYATKRLPRSNASAQSPYPLLMLNIVRQLLITRDAYHSTVGTRGKLACVFDTQHGVGNAIATMKAAFLQSMQEHVKVIAHASSREFVALQTADMWAWSVRRKLQMGAPNRIYSGILRQKAGQADAEFRVETLSRQWVSDLFDRADADDLKSDSQ